MNKLESNNMKDITLLPESELNDINGGSERNWVYNVFYEIGSWLREHRDYEFTYGT